MSERAQSSMPLFYSAIEPLDKERHASLGLKKDRVSFAFAAKASAVPINTPEFNFALKNYPIVFTSTTEPQAIAILGLQRDQNLFVEEDGTWMKGAYIPAYVRRYPFIFGTMEGSDQFAFCVDTGSEMVTDTPDVPFFENGDLSEAARQGVETCQVFQQQHAISQNVMEHLAATGLLAQREAKFKMRDGSERVLGTYIGIDEDKLAGMSDEQFLEMRRSNVLPYIYLHLASLSNWLRLLDLHIGRNKTGDTPPPDPDTETPPAPSAGT